MKGLGFPQNTRQRLKAQGCCSRRQAAVATWPPSTPKAVTRDPRPMERWPNVHIVPLKGHKKVSSSPLTQGQFISSPTSTGPGVREAWGPLRHWLRLRLSTCPAHPSLVSAPANCPMEPCCPRENVLSNSGISFLFKIYLFI